MSAVDVIRRRVTPHTLTRPGAHAIVDGIATPAAGSDITIDAYSQPMSPKELRNLPPGQNAGEWRNVWTEDSIKIRDVITINGNGFTVQRVSVWEEGPFTIANVNRIEDVLT